MEVVRGSASKNVRNLCSIKADNVGLHTECFGLNKLIYAFFFFKYKENGQDSHLSDDITEPHISFQNIAFPHLCYKLKASRHHLNKL